MSNETLGASSDLIRWLRMLALPTWAKSLLAVIMTLVLGSALALLGHGVWTRSTEAVSSAVTILTVGLPVGLVVVALVFGDGGAQKLQALTQLVLAQEVPHALRQNLAVTDGYAPFIACDVKVATQGCIADYHLLVQPQVAGEQAPGKARALSFKLELNVRKANLVLWLPAAACTAPEGDGPYESCFFGATREGYVRNAQPLTSPKAGMLGVVFIKALSPDFLLSPGERLYFAQDLAFFIRGILSVELQQT